MTTLLESARSAIDEVCLVKGGLKKDGCKVVMTGAPAPRLVVDFDKSGSPLERHATRCDYLLVAEGEHACGWVAVLELKRGRLHADQVVRQLRAGARAAEKVVPAGEAVRFRPIAASGRTPIYERRKLRDRSCMIALHGKKEPVRLMSCGARLITALGP